jgi:hypothetical protein
LEREEAHAEGCRHGFSTVVNALPRRPLLVFAEVNANDGMFAGQIRSSR